MAFNDLTGALLDPAIAPMLPSNVTKELWDVTHPACRPETVTVLSPQELRALPAHEARRIAEEAAPETIPAWWAIDARLRVRDALSDNPGFPQGLAHEAVAHRVSRGKELGDHLASVGTDALCAAFTAANPDAAGPDEVAVVTPSAWVTHLDNPSFCRTAPPKLFAQVFTAAVHDMTHMSSRSAATQFVSQLFDMCSAGSRNKGVCAQYLWTHNAPHLPDVAVLELLCTDPDVFCAASATQSLSPDAFVPADVLDMVCRFAHPLSVIDLVKTRVAPDPLLTHTLLRRLIDAHAVSKLSLTYQAAQWFADTLPAAAVGDVVALCELSPTSWGSNTPADVLAEGFIAAHTLMPAHVTRIVFAAQAQSLLGAALRVCDGAALEDLCELVAAEPETHRVFAQLLLSSPKCSAATLSAVSRHALSTALRETQWARDIAAVHPTVIEVLATRCVTTDPVDTDDELAALLFAAANLQPPRALAVKLLDTPLPRATVLAVAATAQRVPAFLEGRLANNQPYRGVVHDLDAAGELRYLASLARSSAVTDEDVVRIYRRHLDEVARSPHLRASPHTSAVLEHRHLPDEVLVLTFAAEAPAVLAIWLAGGFTANQPTEPLIDEIAAAVASEALRRAVAEAAPRVGDRFCDAAHAVVCATPGVPSTWARAGSVGAPALTDVVVRAALPVCGDSFAAWRLLLETADGFSGSIDELVDLVAAAQA